jgi:hypothetical protein
MTQGNIAVVPEFIKTGLAWASNNPDTAPLFRTDKGDARSAWIRFSFFAPKQTRIRIIKMPCGKLAERIRRPYASAIRAVSSFNPHNLFPLLVNVTGLDHHT